MGTATTHSAAHSPPPTTGTPRHPPSRRTDRSTRPTTTNKDGTLHLQPTRNQKPGTRALTRVVDTLHPDINTRVATANQVTRATRARTIEEDTRVAVIQAEPVIRLRVTRRPVTDLVIRVRVIQVTERVATAQEVMELREQVTGLAEMPSRVPTTQEAQQELEQEQQQGQEPQGQQLKQHQHQLLQLVRRNVPFLFYGIQSSKSLDRYVKQ